jgi:2-oxoglutarate ferredoxin oxidoreductase subunit alpha
VPLTEICNRDLHDPRQRQLFKNIIYVGALSALLDIETEVSSSCSPSSTRARSAARRQRQGAAPRPRLRAANLTCPIGLQGASAPTRSATASSSTATAPRRWARSTAARRSAPGIRSRRRPRWPRPSRSTAEQAARRSRTGKRRYAIVQAEDELASIGMVIGAGWNGARAFTATSGPASR